MVIDGLGFYLGLAVWLGIAIPFGDDDPSNGNLGEGLGFALGPGTTLAFLLYQIRAAFRERW